MFSVFVEDLCPVYVYCEFVQAIVTLKKGAYLLRCGRRGKPKFCPFRLSTVASSFMSYVLRVFFFFNWNGYNNLFNEQSLKNCFSKPRPIVRLIVLRKLLKNLIYLKYGANFQTLEAS